MLEWSDDYLTGVEEMDLQHRYFLRLINRIQGKLARIVLSEGHAPLLLELGCYAKFHFVSEENLMDETGYPALVEHRALHKALIDRLHGEIALLENDLVGPDSIVTMLEGWFREHTLVEDMKYARFLTARADRTTDA
jgi:hemerythrin-like metal-binding protein